MKVLLFGTFDDLHPGHRFLIERAKERGELWVVIARDANVMKIKGREPLQNEEQRKHAIEEAYPDVRVVLGDPANFMAPVADIGPDLIVLGYDQHLPPGVSETDLPCPVERMPSFEPHIHKSSLRRARAS